MNPNNPSFRDLEKQITNNLSLFSKAQKALANYYDLPIEAIVPEFFDFLTIVNDGAKKYKMLQWLNEDGKTMSEKENHDHMFHHLAESYSSGQAFIFNNDQYLADKDSGFDPLLHLACRALMLYTRRQRNIRHPEDK